MLLAAKLDGSNLNTPEICSAVALEAIKGGASGIRAQGIDNLTYFKKVINVPIIGLVKKCFGDGTVAITRDF